MNPIRFRILRARAAELLHLGKPLLTTETQLLDDLRLFVEPQPTEAEFAFVMGRMERDRQILRHRTEDEGVKVKLTETGEAEFPQ